MEIRDKCPECGNNKPSDFKCDSCGKPLDIGIPITIHYGFAHYLDTLVVHFCCDECAIDYLKKEQLKDKGY
jgi:hypothetical protein